MKFAFYMMGLTLAVLVMFQSGCGKESCPSCSESLAEKPVNTEPVYGKPFADVAAQKKIDDSAAEWGVKKKAFLATVKKLRAREDILRKNLKSGEDFEVVCGADGEWKTLKAEMVAREAETTAASRKIADAVRAATASERTTK